MRKLAALTISLFMVSAPVIADTPKDADAQPVAAEAAKAAKPKAAAAKAAKKAENRAASFAAELEELRQTLQSQQEQLQLLKEELAKRDRQIDEAREAATAANARAAEANAKAVEAVSSTASVRTTTDSLNTTVTALKTSGDSLATTVPNQQAAVKAAEETGPASIKYKGITITPGGFLAAETVTRSRTASADINTPFTGIPYPGNALSKVAENNFTARQSRIILLGETKIGSAKATRYYEADFRRYGSAQLADMTFRPNGTAALIRTAHGLGIFELHPNPKLDVYFYYGAEYAWRAAYQGYQIASATTAGGVTTVTSANNRIGGYGSPFASNQGCSTENPPSGPFTPSSGGTCNGDIRIIQEGTLGFWHKFYQGPKGGLRWGLQYSYITKSGWSGNNLPTGIGTGVGVAPKAVDNMFWTSFRYYIP